MIDFSSKKDIFLEDEDGLIVPMSEPYFRAKPIAPGTWQVLSDGDYSYLLEGDDEALLIDSGYGAGDIRAYCQTLTEKPLSKIANTHHHFDHTANNSYFDLAYMSAATKPLATIPFPSFAGIDFPRDYPVQIVGDGDVIPLKGRELLVFEIPDHAVGSLAFLDRKERILFSGDEFMLMGKSLNGGVAHWLAMLQKLAPIARILTDSARARGSWMLPPLTRSWHAQSIFWMVTKANLPRRSISPARSGLTRRDGGFGNAACRTPEMDRRT